MGKNNGNSKSNKEKPSHLYLIDGDNHINEALERIDLADETDDVRIYVSQDGQFNKLKNKDLPHVKVIKVPQGNQAVDNRIKSVLGSELENGDFDELYVISHDKGYDDMIQNKRSRYKKRKDKLDRRELF